MKRVLGLWALSWGLVPLMMLAIAHRCFAAPARCGEAASDLDKTSRGVYKSVRSSIVTIENEESAGTGIILDSTGLVLTNAHVLISSLPYKCTGYNYKQNGDEVSPVVFDGVEIVGVHPSLDLALLRIHPERQRSVLTPVILRKDAPPPHSNGWVIGNTAAGRMIFSKAIIGTELVEKGDNDKKTSYFHIDDVMDPGSAGCPLCDNDGHVAGLVTFLWVDHTVISVAVPLQNLDTKEFLPLAKRMPNPKLASEMIDMAQWYQGRVNIPNPNTIHAGKQNKLVFRAYESICYRLAELNNPLDPNIRSAVGELLEDMGDTKGAARSYLRAMQLDPWRSPEAYLRLASKITNEQLNVLVLREAVAKYPYEQRLWLQLSIDEGIAGKSADAVVSMTVAALIPGGNRGLGDAVPGMLAGLKVGELADAKSRMSNRNVATMLDGMAARSQAARKAHAPFIDPEFIKMLAARCGPVPQGLEIKVPTDSVLRPEGMDAVANGNPPFAPSSSEAVAAAPPAKAPAEPSRAKSPTKNVLRMTGLASPDRRTNPARKMHPQSQFLPEKASSSAR